MTPTTPTPPSAEGKPLMRLSRVTLRKLRRELPAWAWGAARWGMSWHYIGRKGDRRVEVYAVSILCGPGDDDHCTEWRVEEGQSSDTYAAFWCRESLRDAPTTSEPRR